MKILIFSDVHTHIDRAEAIIKKEAADVNICLGDIFDDFGDNVNDNILAAYWLKEKLNQKNFICTWGNHDISYAWPGPHTDCSGYTSEKMQGINSVLTAADWSKIRWYYWLNDNTLLSHAGLSNYWIISGSIKRNLNEIKDFLFTQSNMVEIALRNDKPHWFFRAGRGRGGRLECGGLTWCDIREFQPIPGISQIFGHTPQRVPKLRKLSRTFNVCIDTRLNYYGIYQNGKFEVKENRG